MNMKILNDCHLRKVSLITPAVLKPGVGKLKTPVVNFINVLYEILVAKKLQC